jgi:hypothetical protein
MPRRRSMKTEAQGAAYHDVHMDDPEEWDQGGAEHVEPKPSGMAVFSLRLPAQELQFLKNAADQRGTTMSELTRTALRFYLMPRATASLSATAFYVNSMTPMWMGGILGARSVQYERVTPPSNAVPSPATT